MCILTKASIIKKYKLLFYSSMRIIRENLNQVKGEYNLSLVTCTKVGGKRVIV